MSRYFFHIRDGLVFVPDEEGLECRDMQAVQDEARASARDMVNAALHGRPSLPAAIEIEDERGNHVPQTLSRNWMH